MFSRGRVKIPSLFSPHLSAKRSYEKMAHNTFTQRDLLATINRKKGSFFVGLRWRDDGMRNKVLKLAKLGLVTTTKTSSGIGATITELGKDTLAKLNQYNLESVALLENHLEGIKFGADSGFTKLQKVPVKDLLVNLPHARSNLPTGWDVVAIGGKVSIEHNTEGKLSWEMYVKLPNNLDSSVNGWLHKSYVRKVLSERAFLDLCDVLAGVVEFKDGK